MLILMVKKYGNLLFVLAAVGAIAVPVVYFRFFDHGKNVLGNGRNACGR